MTSYVQRIHIDAPPEVVFEHGTDLPGAARRISAIKKIEILSPGPVGVGTRFRETRTVLRREATEEMVVTAFDPPHAWSFGCENHGCRYAIDFRVRPSGAGSELEMRFEGIPLTRAAKVLAFLARPLAKACLRETAKDLADLKASVEARRARAASAG